MDWTLCVICQQTTSEHVKCPLNAPGSGDKSILYESFLNRINAFRELNQLPAPLAEGITVNDLTFIHINLVISNLTKIGWKGKKGID